MFYWYKIENTNVTELDWDMNQYRQSKFYTELNSIFISVTAASTFWRLFSPPQRFEAFMFCWYAIGQSNQLQIFKSSDFRLGLSSIMFKKLGCFKMQFRQSDYFLLRKGNFVAEANSVVERKSLLLQIQLNDGFICKRHPFSFKVSTLCRCTNWQTLHWGIAKTMCLINSKWPPGWVCQYSFKLSSSTERSKKK